MKKLHYSTRNRIIAGICGGIAETYNIDPTLVRLLFVIISLFYGTGIIIYITLLLIMPKEKEFEDDLEIKPQEKNSRKIYRLYKGKMIAGVCNGLAEIGHIDVTLLRLIFVLVTLFSSGIAAILYLLLWMFVPYRDL